MSIVRLGIGLILVGFCICLEAQTQSQKIIIEDPA
jgi:hypothetical protein